MNIETKIINFIKQENKNLEIVGLRGLVKSGEYEWSFRFTYREDDFLSISELIKIQISKEGKTISLKNEKAIKKKKTKTKTV